MEWNVGMRVKFASPECDAEASLVMLVREDRGNRVLVVTPSDTFSDALQPVSVYLKSDLVPDAHQAVVANKAEYLAIAQANGRACEGDK